MRGVGLFLLGLLIPWRTSIGELKTRHSSQLTAAKVKDKTKVVKSFHFTNYLSCPGVDKDGNGTVDVLAPAAALLTAAVFLLVDIAR